MPSKAYIHFQKNAETVERLCKTYYDIKQQQHCHGGRGAFDHLTRSAIVFLVSAFEVYCEDLLRETSEYLIKNAKDAINLPHDVRSTICEQAKKTSPLDLCDEGWRKVYKQIVEDRTNGLNTPNTKNLEKIFQELVGMKPTIIRNLLTDSKGNNMIDPIIIFRGTIVHQVRANQYVQIETVQDYKQVIANIVVQLDKKMCDHIKSQSLAKNQPWRKQYK